MANLLKGASTKAAGNTLSQEAFISKLHTGGALDEGSGFSRAFQPSETEGQYEARLEAWKKGKTGGVATPAPATSPTMTAIANMTGGGAPSSGGGAPSESVDSGEGAAMAPGIGPSIMAGIIKALGRRIPPSNAYVLGPRPY